MERGADIFAAFQNALVAISGKGTVPFPELQAGQNPRRSSSLLGIIKGDTVYDAEDPTIPRFKRVRHPPEPIESYSIWTEILENGRQPEEADYILFAAGDGERQDSSRDREVEGTELGPLGCMLRVPMMEGYWGLASP